jgi:hypothetical protein
MLTTQIACELARGLEGVTEQDHFGSDAFRTPGGIFATVWHETNTVNLRLTVEQQRRFLMLDGEGFIEIDNAWGRQGWTTANLEFLEREQFWKALETAWENSANKPRRTARRRNKTKAARTKPKAGTK